MSATFGPIPQCVLCARWRSPLDGGPENQTCEAFPKAIPQQIWQGKADHRQPFDGDHGLRWTSRNGADFPEKALNIPV